MWSSSNFLTSNLSTSESTTIYNIAQYIEDYIDLVENVPNEVARHLTRLHEFNNKYYQLLEKLSKVLEVLGENDFIDSSNSNGEEEKESKEVEPVIKKDINESTTESTDVKLNERKKGLKALYTLQKCLIEIQEISDEKLFIVQSMFDQLDVKARQLDYDHRNVTNSAFINNLTSSKNSLTLNMSSSSNQHSDSNDHNINSNCLDNLKSESEICLSKDANHTNGSNLSHNVNNCSLSNKRSSSRRNISSSKDINSNGETGNHGKRGVKRGVKGNNNQVKRNKKDNLNNSPPALYEDTPIDPDEPTYCFCEQVSYGEMIGCDNVACRIEWFHFACVSLTTKPKGKWYCPDCRGDRSNIPKK